MGVESYLIKVLRNSGLALSFCALLLFADWLSGLYVSCFSDLRHLKVVCLEPEVEGIACFRVSTWCFDNSTRCLLLTKIIILCKLELIFGLCTG